MKIKLIIIFLFITLSNQLIAQSSETGGKKKSAMKKLHFITGKWKGEGWMMGRDGQKHYFNQTEKVQFKLDSMILLIEGTGEVNGTIVHNALAIVSYDDSDSIYNFQSYLMDGRNGTYTAELIDGTFYWYPNLNIRYIIQIDKYGNWYEIGEMKRGEEWVKFFEMTLDKITE